MKELSDRYDNPAFAKKFWRGFKMALLAAATISITLVLIGLVTAVSISENWK